MTREEHIDNLKSFIECFKDEIEHSGFGDARFDEEQAKKDIETFEAAIKALSQEPTFDDECQKDMDEAWEQIQKKRKRIPVTLDLTPCDDAISRDFQIGDEVRIIGSDPIYDDCDVGWVIRNASEKVKTMYVMRNDGSADEEAKAEWYKTGRHNAMLAEVIKALPSVTQKSGKWITEEIGEGRKVYCSECKESAVFEYVRDGDIYSSYGHGVVKKTKYCPNCGAKMESEDKE